MFGCEGVFCVCARNMVVRRTRARTVVVVCCCYAALAIVGLPGQSRAYTHIPKSSYSVDAALNLRASMGKLQQQMVDLDYNSDEYNEVKETFNRERIRLKNIKWIQIGMPQEDYEVGVRGLVVMLSTPFQRSSLAAFAGFTRQQRTACLLACLRVNKSANRACVA